MPRRALACETLPVTDVRWLQMFTAPSLADTVGYGPIREEPGTASEAARRIAEHLTRA